MDRPFENITDWYNICAIALEICRKSNVKTNITNREKQPAWLEELKQEIQEGRQELSVINAISRNSIFRHGNAGRWDEIIFLI